MRENPRNTRTARKQYNTLKYNKITRYYFFLSGHFTYKKAELNYHFITASL